MQMKRLSPSQLKSRINMILTYQFSAEFAQAFLAPFDRMKFKFSSKTGKLKYIMLDNALQATYRPPFGTFSLNLASVKRIISDIPPSTLSGLKALLHAFIGANNSQEAVGKWRRVFRVLREGTQFVPERLRSGRGNRCAGKGNEIQQHPPLEQTEVAQPQRPFTGHQPDIRGPEAQSEPRSFGQILHKNQFLVAAVVDLGKHGQRSQGQ